MLKFFIYLPILIVIIRQVEKFGHSSSKIHSPGPCPADSWKVRPFLGSSPSPNLTESVHVTAAIFAMRLRENFGGEQELHLRLWCWESDGIWKMWESAVKMLVEMLVEMSQCNHTGLYDVISSYTPNYDKIDKLWVFKFWWLSWNIIKVTQLKSFRSVVMGWQPWDVADNPTNDIFWVASVEHQKVSFNWNPSP